MSEDHCLTTLLGWQGWAVVQWEQRPAGDRTAVVLTLRRLKPEYRCGKCGQGVRRLKDRREQVIQHLTLWEHLTYVRFWKVRVICPTCGVTTEALPWVARAARVSTPLAALVAELCKVMTNKAVALFQDLHRDTVKTIDERGIRAAQAARALDGITTLGIDEIAVGRGQTYWHLVSALDGPRGAEVLFVGEGRKEKDLTKFWKWFGKTRAQQITHAVMDMWKPFRRSFEVHCPGGGDSLRQVSCHPAPAGGPQHRAEAGVQTGRQDHEGLLCGKKFLLLSRQAHVRGKARAALTQLLARNRRLLKAHLLKESFGHLWSYRSKTWARKFFTQWVAQLKWSRLTPYHKFARMVDTHLDGVLAHCDKPVSLGYIEGTNLKARNIIRRAYGYRDKEYMKLKIIQACSSLGTFRPYGSDPDNSS